MTAQRGDERRAATLVAIVCGLLVLPWFWIVGATAGWPVDGSPSPDAGPRAFADFYLANIDHLPLRATLAVGSWILWLLLIVAVAALVRGAFPLAARAATSLATAAIAVYVASEGVLVWPAVGLRAADLPVALDPGVAQALVLSRDGLHAVGSVLLGAAMFALAWPVARAPLPGRWVVAAIGALAGVSACASVVVGPEGLGPGVILLWGLAVAGSGIADRLRARS
ncbi:MAG: hypothetical protein ACKO8G_04505 [Actinomycetota bacterium]